MGAVLDVDIPQKMFARRIQPFGIALAEVAWRVKMFTHDGVVLAAIYLEEPNLIVGMSFWQDEEAARHLFRGTFEIGLCADADPPGRVRLAVELDTEMVDELFTAAELLNPHPNRTSASRAKRHFSHFLSEAFPDTPQVWSRSHSWRTARRARRAAQPIRVG